MIAFWLIMIKLIIGILILSGRAYNDDRFWAYHDQTFHWNFDPERDHKTMMSGRAKKGSTIATSNKGQ